MLSWSPQCQMSEEGISKHPLWLLSNHRDAQERKKSSACVLQILGYLPEVLMGPLVRVPWCFYGQEEETSLFLSSLTYSLLMEGDLLFFPPSLRVCSISLLIKWKSYMNKEQLCFAKERSQAAICMGFIQDQVSPLCGRQLAILESWSKKGFLELSLSYRKQMVGWSSQHWLWQPNISHFWAVIPCPQSKAHVHGHLSEAMYCNLTSAGWSSVCKQHPEMMLGCK